MKKQEFIDRLRMALNGRISPEQVAENINYYEDYINSQMRMGKSEAEVMQSLGDPRLIAKTIIDASEQTDGGRTEYQYSTYRNSTYGNSEYRYENPRQENDTNTRIFHMPKWLWMIIITIIILAVLSLIFSILSFFAPVVFVIVVVVFLVKLFRDWLN